MFLGTPCLTLAAYCILFISTSWQVLTSALFVIKCISSQMHYRVATGKYLQFQNLGMNYGVNQIAFSQEAICTKDLKLRGE